MPVYRDFICLIVLLADVGKAWWFLALTAVGVPIFLLVLGRPGRRSSGAAALACLVFPPPNVAQESFQI